jgi:NADH:ubiquinone oxidoreductase subunit
VDSLFQNPDWENADYFFDADNIVAELKEICHDENEDEELRQRISSIYNRYAEKGVVPLRFGSPMPVRIDRLPEDCRREMMQPFKRKFEGRVKKASKQIKETKARLGRPEAKGLLILVNETSTFLSPDIAFFFLHHLLKGQHSSIGTIIYCSVNMLVQAPGVHEGARLWSSIYRDIDNQVPEELVGRLFSSFKRVVDKQSGVEGAPISSEPNVLESLKFVTRGRINDPDKFVQKGCFYRSPKSGFKYYCESISEGSAKMFLVHSIQRGQLIQKLFKQKLIFATQKEYVKITDREEIAELKAALRKIRRSE